MKKILKNIDGFSRDFRFTYKGENTYKSAFGGFLTLIAIIVIILNGFLIGKDIYYKDNPNVLNYEKYLEYHPTAKINYKENFFGFSISDSSNNIFDDNTVLTVIPVLYTNYYDKKGQLKYKEKYLEITDCLSEFKRLNLTLPMSEEIMTPLKCIKNLNEVLSGAWTEKHLSCLTFEIFECSNVSMIPNTNLNTDEDFENFEIFKKNITNINLLDFNEDINEAENQNFEDLINLNSKEPKTNLTTPVCKTHKDQKRIIPTLYFNFFYSTIVINNKNFNNPTTKKINYDWYVMSTSLFRTVDYYFNHNIIRTDDGFVFSNEYKDNVKLTYYKNSVDYKANAQGETGIIWCNIYISNNIKFSTREYIKLQNIFANLGGIVKLVMIVFNLLIREFYKKKMDLKIMNRLFDFDEIKERQQEEIARQRKNEGNFQNKIDKEICIDTFNKNKNQKIQLHQYNSRNSEKFVKGRDIDNNDNTFSDSGRIGLNDNFNEIQTNRKLNINSDKRHTSFNNENKYIFSKKKFLLERLNRIKKIKLGNDPNDCIYIPKRAENLKIFNSLNEQNNELTKDYLNKSRKDIEPELDKKLNEIIEVKRKLRFSNFETILKTLCKCYTKNGMMLKNSLYKFAQPDLVQFTDYLNTIEIHRSFIKLKYLLLNTQQIWSFQFLTNPKKSEASVHHEIESYALAFEKNFDKKNCLFEIYNYFQEKIQYNNLSQIDQKIFDILLPSLKKIIMMKK